jgi:uncharacterized protein YbcI
VSPDDASTEAAAVGPLMQISREVANIYKEQFGRGPSNASTYFAGRDTIICLLEGTLTPVERTLVALGESQRLQDMRQLFQTATGGQLRAVVERATGRTVIGFMSGNDIERDAACEVFTLAPPTTL